MEDKRDGFGLRESDEKKASLIETMRDAFITHTNKWTRHLSNSLTTKMLKKS